MTHSKDWEEDCLHYWGKVLTGEFGHWCWDWDFLPVDETCDEFKTCGCFTEEELSNGKPNKEEK